LEYISGKNKRRAAYLETLKKYYTQNHRSKKGLYCGKDHHYGCFPAFAAAHQDATKQYVPENPEQKASFLAFPVAGNHVMHGQVIGGMLVSVEIFVEVIVNNIKKRKNHPQDCHGMQAKAKASEAFPALLLGKVAFGAAAVVGKGCQQGSDKGQYHKEVSEIANKGIDHFCRILKR
jgi:hypothetical protein